MPWRSSHRRVLIRELQGAGKVGGHLNSQQKGGRDSDRSGVGVVVMGRGVRGVPFEIHFSIGMQCCAVHTATAASR